MSLYETLKANTVMNTIYTPETFTQRIPHAHRSIEMVYVVSGDVGMDIYPVGSRMPEDLSHIRVLPGQFFLINSFVPHQQYVYKKSHMLIFELDTWHKTAFPKELLAAAPFCSACRPIKNLCDSLTDILLFRDNRNVFSVFSEVLSLFYHNYHSQADDYFEIDLELSLKRLLVEICKCQQLTLLGRKHNAYVAKALSFLDSHYSETISPERISELLGISMHQLNIYLKQEFGRSFNRLHTEKRLDSAKSLLKNTNYSVSTIAEKIGYASLRYFEAAFKKDFGVTPKEYRHVYEEQGFVYWADPDNMSRVMEDFRIRLSDD